MLFIGSSGHQGQRWSSAETPSVACRLLGIPRFSDLKLMDGSQPHPILPGVLANRFNAHIPTLNSISESNSVLDIASPPSPRTITKLVEFNPFLIND